MSEQSSTEPVEPVLDEPVEAAPVESVEAEPAKPTWRRFDLATHADEAFAVASTALASGKLVVLPTDTVYGIAADAMQPEAVQALLDAKQRGRDMPPPVLIAEPGMLRALVAKVPTEVAELAKRHWPGALTLIMKAQSSLRMDLGRTEGTIAVRVPDHDQTRELLRRTGPLAVSSANISGEPAATSVDEAIAQLGNSVAVYLDGGPTPGPTASTIVELASNPAGRIVRQGVIPFEELAQVLTDLVDLPADEPVEEPVAEEPADQPTQAPADEAAAPTSDQQGVDDAGAETTNA